MFDRFIRLAKARKALQDGRLEDAVQLADDPLIRADRRAEDMRRAARDALVQRGRDRLAAGDAAAAARDLQRAVGVQPGEEVEAMLRECRQRMARDGERRQSGQRTLDEARRLAQQGRLPSARAMCEAAGDGDPELQPARQALVAFLDVRSRQAESHRRMAAEQLAQRQVDAAVEQLQKARALDAETAATDLAALTRAAAARLTDVVQGLLRGHDEVAALAEYRQRLQALPELAADAKAVDCGRELAHCLRQRLRSVEGPEDAVDFVQACAAEPALPGEGPAVQAAAQLLRRLPALRTGGRTAELATALAEIGDHLDRPQLVKEAAALRKRAEAASAEIARARTLAAAGDLGGARVALVEVLQELPMHDEARTELDAIDVGAREREGRFAAARQAAKAGRLREAYGLALADALPGPAGEEGRLFAQELRARMDMVGRGLDQVRATLHGRTSGGIAGLRHCLLRVEELAKVQVDHEDIPRLRAALLAETAGIETAEHALAALGKGQFQLVADAIAALVAQREQLLQPDRLDARVLDLADRMQAAAEAALAAGRLAECERCLVGVASAALVRPGHQDVVERIRSSAAQRRADAEALAAEAARLLAARELTAAEQRCEAARQLWVDGSAVRKVEEELQSLRQQQARLQRVEAMAAGGDVEGAHAELGDMPPTPAMLRTRIFDMKQNLARAQGLDGAFLLRVDEGGEFLTLRGESLTIGNLRDGRADLPILAAIAGRHARIQRSMSFHGGMQDSIVAEGGELRVGGQRVANHGLRAGERVQLGSALQIAYDQPSKRSLTSSLQLLGGFQVAGTDRVLLFKDRGRDGRILIGAGSDVHVRVPGAKGEIEIFANKAGQMRVRSEGGGEIDGRPFRDEHPVDAGATVKAAGVTFVMMPWVRPS